MTDANGHYTIRPNDGTKNGDISKQPIATVYTQDHAALAAAAPDMFAALKMTQKLIKTARQYFPKSMRKSDKFDLELTCAAVSKAIAKAKGDL